jgi:hypothetical protein
LNEPDEVQELLLSAIRIPATDEASSTGPKSDDLNGFWARLLGDESETLKAVSNITVEAAGEPDFSNRWPDLSDQLVDLKYSLRARAVLINFIYEILRKFYDLEDYVPQQPAHPVRPAPLSPAPKRNVPGEALETLNLHQKIIDGLQARNIHTVSDLVRVKENELLKIKHFGRKDLKRLKTELDARGLNLGMNVRDSR